MSELTMIAEAIHDAMKAIEEAHHASESLKEDTNHIKFDEFRAKMAVLREHLQKLLTVLDNEEAYAMDELMDALSQVYSDHRADYRKTPRMKE